MKKQKIALLLSLSWLLGLIAVFSFPPSTKGTSDHPSHQSELSEISTPDLIFRTTGQSPEVPAFKAEFHFSDLISSFSETYLIPIKVQYLSPSFFAKSRPLFDVLITFFYFFYTW